MHKIFDRFNNNYNVFLSYLKDTSNPILNEKEIIERFLLGNRSNISEDTIVIAIKYKKFEVAEYMIKNKHVNLLLLFIRFLDNYERLYDEHRNNQKESWSKDEKECKIDLSVLHFFRDNLSIEQIKNLVDVLPNENKLKQFFMPEVEFKEENIKENEE